MRQVRGWSLKELLVVLGIIVLLVILSFPVFQIVHYRYYESRCRANLWSCALKYEELKSQGYKGTDLRRQLMWWMEDNPEVGTCPLTGERYICLTILSEHRIGDELWQDNPSVIVSCSCHPDPRKGYKRLPECGVSQEPSSSSFAVWFLSAVDHGNRIDIEYAPNFVRVQR